MMRNAFKHYFNKSSFLSNMITYSQAIFRLNHNFHLKCLLTIENNIFATVEFCNCVALCLQQESS